MMQFVYYHKFEEENARKIKLICHTLARRTWGNIVQWCDFETMDSSDGPGLGLGLETWRRRSQSWSQDSMLGAYACSTITVICSTFKRVLCHQLKLMQPVMWFRDHGLETRVHFVQVSVSRPDDQGLGLGLETWRPRSRSWSQDLKSKVLVLVSRPKKRSWQQHWYCGSPKRLSENIIITHHVHCDTSIETLSTAADSHRVDCNAT